MNSISDTKSEEHWSNILNFIFYSINMFLGIYLLQARLKYQKKMNETITQHDE